MLGNFQQTLRNSVSATGISLHRGESVSITLHPAPPNTGVVFRRIDLDPACEIPALAESVTCTDLSTTLGQKIDDSANGSVVEVATVEHLLSALRGCGVDNVRVDIDGAEVPVMDGSASPFIFLIDSAGIETQDVARRFIRITRRVRVRQGDAWAQVSPYKGVKYTYRMNYEDGVLQRYNGSASVDLAKQSYLKDLGRARTFGKMSDLEALRKKGLALGASVNNAIALGEYRVINKSGLRYEDEFARHKILDAVGDLSLLGGWMVGHFTGYKSGHGLNSKLLLRLLASPQSWEEIELSQSEVDGKEGNLNTAGSTA